MFETGTSINWAVCYRLKAYCNKFTTNNIVKERCFKNEYGGLIST